MIAELAASLERTVAFVRDQVADLSDEEMTAQPPGVPNHAAWTLGHLIHSWQAIACELGAAGWLPADWESQFAYATSPERVAAKYSARDPLLSALDDSADRLRRVLLTCDTARLGEPMADDAARPILPTLGDALLQLVVAHTAYHAGQLAVWRRALGRRAVGVFI